jgi:peptide/nickel transport system substrate-binding protein
MTPFRPNGFEKGQLASSWEFTDPTTLVVHLRQGIHWQNIPPANGREFVASDVVFHFMRMYDQKKGTFTNVVSHTVKLDILQSVTATDKYTVVFKWNTPNQEFIYEGLMVDGSSEMCMENPEAVQQWGDLSDWHHAIGTGPFILTDYVSNSSATLIKNPNYWGYDERYPQNTLPYINEIKILIIPDNATALAGLRTGKIDELDGMSIQTAQDMQKTNPEISQIGIPTASSTSLACRVDVAPYNDIRVRQALQMAINLPEIAQSYYLNSCDPNPLTHFSKLLKGYSFPYDDWPQDLKDQYAYNPTQAKQLLAAAGYPNGFNTDIVAANTWDGDLLQVIKSYFAAVGINMEIRTMDAASYNAFVKLGWKQDALAADANLGLMYEPMMCFNFCRTVDVGNYYRINDPVADAFYPNAMAATSVDGVQKITRAFDEYIARQHWSVSLLEPNTFTFVQPWLKGYSGQDDSLYGSRGPSLMFFYPARFWIDQNLKKNLG